jgi:rod shape determining protein RodA
VTLSDRYARLNWPLLGLALLLTAAGVATVGTASEGHAVDFGRLQTRWAVVALAAAAIVAAVPYERLVRARFAFYAVGLLGLVAVLFVGRGKSAGRWIEVGSFRVQPSEFVKPILVVALAGTLRYREGNDRLKGFALPLALTMVPMLLVMKQPDLGTALLLIPTLFAVLFAAGARVRHLLLVAGAGLAAGLLLYFVPGVLAEFQKDRIRTFVLSDSNEQVAKYMRRDKGHQIDQSQRAVASGGLAGYDGEGGAEEAIRDLPERHTDFAFATAAASWGLLGVSLLLLAYLAFLAILLSTAYRVREPSGRLLVVGVFALFATQIVVNLGMTVGLLPVVGVTLPFLSYGGSSLLTSFLAVGMVLSVGVESPIEFGRDPLAA